MGDESTIEMLEEFNNNEIEEQKDNQNKPN